MYLHLAIKALMTNLNFNGNKTCWNEFGVNVSFLTDFFLQLQISLIDIVCFLTRAKKVSVILDWFKNTKRFKSFVLKKHQQHNHQGWSVINSSL